MRKTAWDAEQHGGTFFWKLLSILGILAAAFFALVSLGLKEKNDQYRDALISMSEDLPADEGEIE